MIDRIINFFKDARLELMRVSWPTRQQTIRYTVAVVAMSIILSIFLGGLDFLFTYLLNTFLL